MDFKNDPIAEKVENDMSSLRKKGVIIEGGSQYNRVFEALYELRKQLSVTTIEAEKAERLAEAIEKIRKLSHNTAVLLVAGHALNSYKQ